MNAKKNLILLAWLFLLGMPALSARSINWGTAVNDLLYSSSGTPLDDTYIFEVGSFGSSFIPTEFNMDQWAANWKTFDRAVDGDGWNPGDQWVSSIENLQIDGSSSFYTAPAISPTFSAGELGYIWVYKNDTTYSPGLEWALVTNNSSDGSSSNDWSFPVHSDQTSLPLEWYCSNATAVIFGGLNSTQGAGDYTSTPGAFCFQTHTITPVPEPSGALMIATFYLLVITKRIRKQA